MGLTVRQLVGLVHSECIRKSIMVCAREYFRSRDGAKFIKSFSIDEEGEKLSIYTCTKAETEKNEYIDIIHINEVLDLLSVKSKDRIYVVPHMSTTPTDVVKYLDYSYTNRRWELHTYSQEELEHFREIDENRWKKDYLKYSAI